MGKDASPSRYEPSGWTHWPALPAWSAQFLRVLGVAQEGAASIGECFLAASRITPGDAESWYAEWLRMARLNEERGQIACRSGYTQSAQANLLRAANYYRAAEVFLAPADPRRKEVFGRMLTVSHLYLAQLSPAGERMSIALEGTDYLDAYLLKPPGSDTAWPAVVCFGGLDSHKDELLYRVTRHALSRGIAVLLLDLPGQGEALRMRGMSNRVDLELAVGRALDCLSRRADVDSTRLGVYGASLGGVYAARAAAFETRIRAVVSDSLVFDLPAHLSGLLQGPDEGVWAMLQWVFGCSTPQEVVRKSEGLALAGLIPHIRCPYLIVQGEYDFLGLQTAVDAANCARAHGVAVDFKVFRAEETGASHCQADNPTLGQEWVWDWLVARLASRAP
jgi:dienelactone hydrolase